MAQAPSPPYIAARYHGGHQSAIHRIVIHATVSPCERGGARNIAHFFATNPNKTSAHYVVDPGEVIQCVYDHTVAYHAPPNAGSIGIEMCDPVSGPDSRWDDANHRAMLERTAALARQLCDAYGVPKRWLYPADLRAGQHGITDHENVSNAWHQTTHTDPRWRGGRSAAFMRLVLGGADPTPSTPSSTATATTTQEDDMSKQDVLDGLREYFNTEWHDVPWTDQQVSLRDTILSKYNIASWNPDQIDDRVLADHIRTIEYHLLKIEAHITGGQQ